MKSYDELNDEFQKSTREELGVRIEKTRRRFLITVGLSITVLFVVLVTLIATQPK